MGVVFFVQAEKEDAAGFEIAGDVVDDVADVDVAVGVDGAVDYVFVEWVGWHGFWRCYRDLESGVVFLQNKVF